MRNLLVYRFVIANALIGCLAGAMWINGYAQFVITTGAPISYGILALFAVGFVWTFKEVMVVSGGLNEARLIGADPAIAAQAEKDSAKIDWLSSVAEWLVAFGLIGTVVGFMVALSGIGEVTDADGALRAVAHLGEGMWLALTTTLLGASLAIWMEFNVRLLKTGLAVYWSDRIAADHGVGNVRGVD